MTRPLSTKRREGGRLSPKKKKKRKKIRGEKESRSFLLGKEGEFRLLQGRRKKEEKNLETGEIEGDGLIPL